MRVSSLHIYPIKSSRGLSQSSAQVEPEGLVRDRRWVIIDSDDNFISQRTHPDLAKLDVALNEDGLNLTFEGGTIFVREPEGRVETFKVWKDSASGHVADQSANGWLSERLGEPVRLVAMGGMGHRAHTNSLNDETISVSYADAYPILITTTGSLRALNDYLGVSEPDVPMSRFRPNIVIDGSPAWAEDQWSQIRLGNVTLDIIKPCTRCIMTTLNPLTGESEGQGVMRALTALRRSTDPRIKGVLFGMNAVPSQFGRVHVGDSVEIISLGKPWPIAT